jgi:transposase
MDVKKLPERAAFENLPRRWGAERTFAWISHNRRMRKDYARGFVRAARRSCTFA